MYIFLRNALKKTQPNKFQSTQQAKICILDEIKSRLSRACIVQKNTRWTKAVKLKMKTGESVVMWLPCPAFILRKKGTILSLFQACQHPHLVHAKLHHYCFCLQVSRFLNLWNLTRVLLSFWGFCQTFTTELHTCMCSAILIDTRSIHCKYASRLRWYRIWIQPTRQVLKNRNNTNNATNIRHYNC